MYKRNKLVCIVFLILVLCVFCASSLVYSAVAHLINYQGRLTDTSGKPLEGSYSLTFRLYDGETAGSLLWQGTYNSVSITKGVFSILLGDMNAPGFDFAALSFDKQYWLEIKVGDEVMTPRQRITSVGYAINADTLDNQHASDFIEQNSIAGGDLTENYPNPVIGAGKITASKASSLFGSWSSKSNDTVYQAATDGFVLAQRTDIFNRNNLAGYTDSGNPPTTQVAVAGNTGSPEGDHKFATSIIFPVRKNDYWKVVQADVVYWVPLGS